jgi:DNA-binding response OmpR family regulator
MKLPFRILLVDDDENAVAGIYELLRDADYDVTAAVTYDAAKRLLALGSFDLLITDVRLRGFNGLHLVMQSRADHPDMAVMLITGYDEPLMELEANRYNAVFVRKPVKPPEFLEDVAHVLARVRRQRRWPRKQVAGGFRVTAAGKPAAVTDVSYGGLRLEIPGESRPPASFDVEVSGTGLHLLVEPVWWRASDDQRTMTCGAVLALEGTPAARTWREIVDRLNA